MAFLHNAVLCLQNICHGTASSRFKSVFVCVFDFVLTAFCFGQNSVGVAAADQTANFNPGTMYGGRSRTFLPRRPPFHSQ